MAAFCPVRNGKPQSRPPSQRDTAGHVQTRLEGVALAAMLKRFGRLTLEHSGQLEVFAFEIPPDRFTNANARDGHMASVIGRHRALAADGEYVVVLVGNAHAFAAPGAPWKPESPPSREPGHPPQGTRSIRCRRVS